MVLYLDEYGKDSYELQFDRSRNLYAATLPFCTVFSRMAEKALKKRLLRAELEGLLGLFIFHVSTVRTEGSRRSSF